MNLDLEITKDIVAAMAPGFNGDGRLAAVALQRVSATLKSYDQAQAKTIARDIIVAMGPTFEGNVNKAVKALDRILSSMVIKSRGHGEAGEIDVQVVE